MKTAVTTLSLVLSSAALLPSNVTAQAASSGSEREVRGVVDLFKTSLRSGDSTTVIRLLHPEVRIYEGGHAETREEYRSGHLRGDIAFLAGLTSETLWDQVVVGEELVLYMSEYRTTGQYRDREIDSHGTETLVLVSTDDGWRIRHIHWSSR